MSGPGQSGWGNEPGGYGNQGGGDGGYGSQPSYGNQPSYGSQGDGGYGAQPSYGNQGGGYGGQPSYGDQSGGYGQPSYGDQGQSAYQPTTEQGYGQPGGYGSPYGAGSPPPKKSNTGRNVALIVVAVLVLVGAGFGIAAATGAFSGDDTPIATGSSTAPSTPDFGTGSPTAGQTEDEDEPTDDPSSDSTDTSAPSGDYDADPPSESDARDTMGAFWGAASGGDVDAALDYVCPEYRSEFETELAETDSESGFEIDFDKSSYLGTDTEGGARSLEYELTVTLDDGTSADLDYKAVLRSLDGDTLVCGRSFEEK